MIRDYTITARSKEPGYADAKAKAHEVADRELAKPGVHFLRVRAYREGDEHCLELTFREHIEVTA